MSKNKVTVFLPCRAGSERVPQKNTRPFANEKHGLLGVKLSQLSQCESVDCVVLDSNDAVVLDVGSQIKKEWSGNSELLIKERPDHLGTSQTTTDDLIAYALQNFPGEHMLWTHVTSPFVNGEVYGRMIRAYWDCLSQGYDSLMTVNKIQTFLWNEAGPVNYDKQKMRWPRTQDLKPVFEVNSGAFLVSLVTAVRWQDRIGEQPLLFELNHSEAFDIDWPQDFEMAERLWKAEH